MATRNQQIIGISLGLLIGAKIGYDYSKNNAVVQEERWRYCLGGGVAGALCGYAISILLGSANDTVNYKLVNGRKRVYHGITYENRIEARMMEHLRSGKKFTRMIVDKAIPRPEAMHLEKLLIKKHKPFYNIQHNN
jgi:hypothetical protein